MLKNSDKIFATSSNAYETKNSRSYRVNCLEDFCFYVSLSRYLDFREIQIEVICVSVFPD